MQDCLSPSENLFTPLPLTCETEAPSLWSLLDVLKAYAHLYSGISATIVGLAYQLDVAAKHEMTAELSREIVTQSLRYLNESTSTESLPQTRSAINRLFVMLENLIPLPEIAIHLRSLQSLMESELRGMKFLYLPPPQAGTYLSPTLGYRNAIAAFPSIEPDVVAAAHCAAFGLYTASVYHCMGIAQAGLHALANDRKVEFSYPVELAEWNAVISKIEEKIEPMREGPRSAQKDADLSFYSGCAVQFRYFKDAWRNHVCHMREVYDADQCKTIFVHVRDFMNHLATRIAEKKPNA